jgi:hypothetical protein
MREVMWEDPEDRRPFAPPPESFYSPYIWDGADNAVFRPFARAWLLPTSREAMNVNALDEVPDSSWFANRLSRTTLSPEEVARGACADLDDNLPEPITVIRGKPDGANPGFFIKDINGVRYMMKTDGLVQPERASAADTIGAALFHAAGYFVPCNRVVVFSRDALSLAEDAEVRYTNGKIEAMNQSHVDAVLEKATRLPDGRIRASVSQFIDGRPISPWRYQDTREDDPNDVVPHQHRRELRGMYVLAAWLNHFDSRQENTMAAWMQTHEDGRGYVRHYKIDFGEVFGLMVEIEGLDQRFGHSGYLDLPHMFQDLVTFGVIARPWQSARFGPAGPVLGYFNARHFVADAWVPGYPNPAFNERTERDSAWMARIIARIREPHIRAAVARGRFSEPVVANELYRILVERRRRILERYLTRLSPLTWPEVRDSRRLCMQDLAVWSGIRPASTRRYQAIAWSHGRPATLEVTRTDDAWVCTALPPPPTGDPDYVILDLTASSDHLETAGPARVHLYTLANGEVHIAGLERPENGEASP